MSANKKISSLDFKTLQIFLKVAESPSFRKAADELGNITQARVSQCIEQLEEFLGIHLLDRDGRNRRLATLTAKGKEFRVHAERLIRMRKELEAVFRDPSTVGGIVRLGVSESIVHTWLPALLKQVDAAYPNLEIEIEVDITPKLRDLLVARELDLAFLLGPIGPELHSRPVCKFPVAFYASKEIALPRKSITLEDIVSLNHRIITFARNTQPLMALRDLLRDRGLHATIWASASLEAVVRLALEGLGIAVIPPHILEMREATREKLRLLKITDVELPPLDYVVSWSSAPNTADDVTVQKVIDIAMKVAQAWPKVGFS
jgi:DNA-binding transcriptional LysR family regulator